MIQTSARQSMTMTMMLITQCHFSTCCWLRGARRQSVIFYLKHKYLVDTSYHHDDAQKYLVIVVGIQTLELGKKLTNDPVVPKVNKIHIWPHTRVTQNEWFTRISFKQPIQSSMDNASLIRCHYLWSFMWTYWSQV